MSEQRTYVALGDSMSIDDYTGVAGGGAVNQFHRWLAAGWSLVDVSYDGCRISGVPTNHKGHLITLTIGGNDLLCNREEYLAHGLSSFGQQHLQLLHAIRQVNPLSLLIVGDVYSPQGDLSDAERLGLAAANGEIRENCDRVGAQLAEIHAAFRGHEDEYLCRGIEPTLKGAETIARLFREVYQENT